MSTKDFSFQNYVERYKIDSRNANPIVSNQRASRVVKTLVTSGVSNPSWRVQIASGSSASSNYSTEFFELHPATTSAQSQTLKSGLTSNYSISDSVRCRCAPLSYPTPGISDRDVADKALTAFKNRLKSSTGGSSTMAPIVESRELSGLIRKAADFTTEFLLAYRDLRKGRTKRARALIYDLWLTWNFGISPMVGDIQKASEAVADYLGRSDRNVRHTASSRKDGRQKLSAISSDYEAPLGARIVTSGDVSWSLSYRYVGAYHLNLLSSNNYSAFDHLGLDLSSLPQTLWELTAFSWMADYFSNVGEYLDDIFYSPPGNLKYLVECCRYEASYSSYFSSEVIPTNPNNIILLESGNGTSSAKYNYFRRTVLSSLPHIGLRIKTQDDIGKNAVSKLLNLVSVLRP